MIPVPTTALLFLLAFTAAFLAQLVRQLMKAHLPGSRQVVSSSVGAGLAGVATIGLMREWLDVSVELGLAVSLVVGWSGVPILDLLGRVLSSRLSTYDRP